MRHRNFGKILGRNHNQRQALFKGLVRSIFTHGHLQTTETKAKAVMPLVEKLCSVSLKNDLVARRELYRYLGDRNWVNRVVQSMVTAYGDQKSNFTSLVRVKNRQGDNAVVVRLNLTKAVSFQPQPKAEVKKEKPAEAKSEKSTPVKKVKKSTSTK